MIIMDEINYKLDVFEGPLDLLLRLIVKNKVNIYDIPIALIFEQYMQHIDRMQKLDMDVTGDFIAMAAELMLIKSRMLIPKTGEPEEDPRTNLVYVLEEYKRIKEITISFSQQYDLYGGRFIKEPDFIEKEMILGSYDISLLRSAFYKILRRNMEYNENTVKPEKVIDHLLSYRAVSITGRIYGIIRHLYKNGDTSFRYFMYNSDSRSEIIATFMALLELLNVQRIIIISDDDTESDFILHLNKEHKIK